MIDAYYPTVKQLIAHKRTRNTLLLLFGLATTLLVFGSMIALHLLLPKMEVATEVALGGAIFVTLATPVMIWNNPRVGLYIIFGACCLLEVDGRGSPAKIFTNDILFFLNYNNIGTFYGTNVLSAIKFCPAEQFIVLTIMSWLIRGIAKRDLHFERGAFLNVLLLYIACVTFGFVHGMAVGGDFLTSLWEIRPQFLLLAAYVMTANVITDRKQLVPLFWIAVIGLGIRGFLGIQAYFNLVGHITDQGILAHEDSLLFNILFFFPIILSFCKAPRNMIWWSLAFVPAAVFSDLENNRRAGIAAFMIAFLALLMMIWHLLPEQRKRIGIFVVATGLIATIYLPVAWNSDAAWAFPARAIRSQSDPDSRDASSDLYRYMEDTDLKYTRDTSPWIGYGYGRPWIEIIPLPHVTGNGFLQVVAHNSVLWVWMRLGHIGFFCFMMMLATTLIRGTQLCSQTKDPLLQTFGVITILYFMMCYIYGKFDLAYVNYRTMIMMGMLMAILGTIPKLAADEEPATSLAQRIGAPPNEDDEPAIHPISL